jgi:PAP2 superfamily
MGRRFSKLEVAITMCAISTLATTVIKDQLKFAFGRTWPDTWGPGIVSLVRDNVYGFHFFQSGKSFESFPSGHAAVAAAVLSVIWILFPSLRRICAMSMVAVDIGLVALNLHFVSDVVAGSFIGISTGLFTIALCRASKLEMQNVKVDYILTPERIVAHLPKLPNLLGKWGVSPPTCAASTVEYAVTDTAMTIVMKFGCRRRYRLSKGRILTRKTNCCIAHSLACKKWPVPFTLFPLVRKSVSPTPQYASAAKGAR